MNRLSDLIHRTLNLNTDIVRSSLYNETTFYKSFIADLNNCKRTVLIESPYLTTKRAAALLPVLARIVKRGVVVTVSTRHPNEHDAVSRAQAYTVMASLHSIGVDLRLETGHLHRKIAILDDCILWEGSLNILSQNTSKEMMRRSFSRQLVRQMIRFIGYK